MDRRQKGSLGWIKFIFEGFRTISLISETSKDSSFPLFLLLYIVQIFILHLRLFVSLISFNFDAFLFVSDLQLLWLWLWLSLMSKEKEDKLFWFVQMHLYELQFQYTSVISFLYPFIQSWSALLLLSIFPCEHLSLHLLLLPPNRCSPPPHSVYLTTLISGRLNYTCCFKFFHLYLQLIQPLDLSLSVECPFTALTATILRKYLRLKKRWKYKVENSISCLSLTKVFCFCCL